MKSRRAACLLCLFLIGRTPVAVGQNSATTNSADFSYDLKGQSISDLQVLQQRFVDLANTIPADKLSWRPSSDTRSFAEVFLHVAAERYVILGLSGVAVPPRFQSMIAAKSTTEFEKSTPGDRARITDELSKSWEFTRNTLSAFTNAALTKALPHPGRQKNTGDLLYLLIADQHEHLGQAVVYARLNGIVPPWTAAPQRVSMRRNNFEEPATTAFDKTQSNATAYPFKDFIAESSKQCDRSPVEEYKHALA